MNIFVDFHHFGLLTSLRMLFVDRLHHDLFIPTGLEWFPEYWGIAEPYNNDPRTADQYLNHPLNIPHVKAITLEEFKSMPIDMVIASVPENIPHYKKLIANFHPEAKFIVQIGNMFHEVLSNLHEIPNLLASTISFEVPPSCNAVFYHQRFDTNVYKYKPPTYSKKIKSFMNVIGGYPDLDFLYEIERYLPEWKFEFHGASCRDGIFSTDKEIADSMSDSQFILHVKYGGDGFGYIIHQAFAVGRPPIVKREYYKGQLAEQLMEDGITCIQIDSLSAQESANKIIKFSEPDIYLKMCENARDRFLKVVDWDKEEIEIEKFMAKLN